MRIALVSPYSWTYPGGVTRHIEALAEELIGQGHDVRVLTPVDRDTTAVRWLHVGAAPAPRALPDYVIPLGGTAGVPANGAVSNVAMTPSSVARLRHELRTGGYDVVHVHSPDAPALGWDAVMSTDAPVVATFHAYTASRRTALFMNAIGASRMINKIDVRIAVSEAAAWTARRWHGGALRIIPNGVHVPAELPASKSEAADAPLDIAFVGQAVERKGLPVLLRAFEALRDHVDATLTLVGPTQDEIAPMLLDDRGITALGKVDDAEKSRVLARADVLAAPSLGGESFGMVLTEAFAHATPVVASDIAGYRDVVRDGLDGVLVPRGDAAALANELRDLALDRPRLRRMGETARADAERYAWPRVARDVLGAYEDAIAQHEAQAVARTASTRVTTRFGLTPADGAPAATALPRYAPTLEPRPTREERGRRAPLAVLKRAALFLVAVATLVGAFFAVQRIGLDAIGNALLAATPTWVIAGLGIMCASMVLRAVAWRAILSAGLPDARVRFSDALQGTFIGVFMSATLPARLGEPARALIVARRLGRPRERLPVVLGTIISQTLLNILALLILGVTMLSTVDLFRDNHALVGVAIAPMIVLVCVLIAPAILRGGGAKAVARALEQVRAGLKVFRRPKLGATAVVAQLSAWVLQALSCYVLLVALGLDDTAGIGAAAAVLFAVNVTAVLPATPSNLGVFQAACVVVLGAYGVGKADALAYGIILQAVEIATAVVMGAPALVKEGVSWRDVRLRALHATPVTLAPIPGESRATSG